MVRSTIPHEVAHILAWKFPQLGIMDHNPKWRAVDAILGGNGEEFWPLVLDF
jgi:predicted SprT family Zn-dependent metalloprotease